MSLISFEFRVSSFGLRQRKAEGRGQKAEGRRQKAEGGRRKAGDETQSAVAVALLLNCALSFGRFAASSLQ